MSDTNLGCVSQPRRANARPSLHLFLPPSEVLPALILASPCGALHPPLLFFGHQGHDERYFQHHGCAQVWPPSLPDSQLATVIKRRLLVLGTECAHKTNPK